MKKKSKTKLFKKVLISFSLIFLFFAVSFLAFLRFDWSFGIFKPKPVKNKTPVSVVLRFGVVGDPESDLENLTRAVEQIETNQLSLAVLVGDLTQYGSPEQFEAVKSTLSQSEIDWLVIPGNHDLWLARKTGRPVYEEFFGRRFYRVERKGIQLILLDNADYQQGMVEAQLEWLDQTLAGQEPSLVFSHMPFYHPESTKVMGEDSELVASQAAQVLDQLCLKPPLAVVSGHLHHTDDYQYSCSNGQVLRMINAGSVNEERNWQLPRWLKIEVFDDQTVKMEEVEITD